MPHSQFLINKGNKQNWVVLVQPVGSSPFPAGTTVTGITDPSNPGNTYTFTSKVLGIGRRHLRVRFKLAGVPTTGPPPTAAGDVVTGSLQISLSSSATPTTVGVAYVDDADT